MDNYRQLTKRIRRVGFTWRKVLLLEGISFLAIVSLSFVTISFFADNFFHLPNWSRTIILIIFLSLTFTIFLKNIVSALVRSFSNERIALHIEKKFPEFNNRLINSVQLVKFAPQSAIACAIVRDSLLEAKNLPLEKAVSRDHLKRYSRLSAAAGVIFVSYAIFGGRYFNNALARFVTPHADIPPITLTSLSVEPKNTEVLSADDVNITAYVEGRIPTSAQIAYKMGDEDWKLDELSKWNERTFTYIFKGISKETLFYVIAGDVKTPIYSIKVKERPNILNLRVSLKFPDYTDIPPTVEANSNGNIRALAGTLVSLEATVDNEPGKAEIAFGSKATVPMEITSTHGLRKDFTVSEDTTYKIHITDRSGFTNKEPIEHSIVALNDNPPVVEITRPARNMSVEPSEKIPLGIKVTDDYGIREVSILLKRKAAPESTLATWKKSKTERESTLVYELQLQNMGVEPGEVLTYYAVASDWNDLTGPGTGKSRSYSLTILVPQQARELKEAQVKSVKENLMQIIELQETNRRTTQGILAAKNPGKQLTDEITKRQMEIRELSVRLADRIGDELFIVKDALYKLISGEMLRAITELEDKKLSEAYKTQEGILKELKRLVDEMIQSEFQLKVQDAVKSLGEIIKKQKEIRTSTKALSLREGDTTSNQRDTIVRTQRTVATSMSEFREELSSEALKEFVTVVERIDELKIPMDMGKIASYLEQDLLKEAISPEDTVIGNLELIASLIKNIVLGQATEWMKNLKSTLNKTEENLKKLTDIQQAITELTGELSKLKDLSEGEKAKIGKMAEMQNKMEDVVENIAENLKLFPETPISNELLTKMREVYEDVEKSIEAKDMEAVEIAVAMDKTVLEALKSTTERVEDFEMWLPDKPDSIKWNLESFDVSEIPQIPLVELPDELEDLVGELIESQEDVNKLTENVTANWMSADAAMGWGVDEGGISNFSAKGKSGNVRPDSDEITGRSGAGRPGKTSGEIVEGFAKDLEGSPTPPRKTTDPYQKGHVEEENPLSQTGATGGGKQSGYGDEGLSGVAPARDERALEQMAARQSQIRANTETLKAALNLLYLPTGDLDRALLMMKQAEQGMRNRDIQNISETQRSVLHALENTYRSTTGDIYIRAEIQANLPTELKREILAAGDEQYPKEYEKLVGEYFKAISEATFK